MKSKLLIFFLLFLCFVSVSVVYAEDDGCNTKEELFNFLKSDEGGTITLTGDILWDYTSNNLPLFTQPTTIEMGPHKIIIPTDGVMQIQGPVSFYGEGSTMFEAAGLLNLSYGVEVYSSGENAAAIQSTSSSSPQLFICSIVAEGSNAVAIHTDAPINVQLCHISGTKAAIEAPQITLDTSYASPTPPEVVQIHRVPAVERGFQLYGITLPADSTEEQYNEAIYGYGVLSYAFIDPETGSAIGGSLSCDWSNVPAWPAAADNYSLTVHPTDLPDWFPVEIPSFDIPLHIIDSDELWLNVAFADPYFGMLALQFEPNLPDDTAQVSLFYSTDEGQTWKAAAEDFPDSNLQTTFSEIMGLIPDTNYWFYAEITDDTGVRKSNIVFHPNFINDLAINFSYGGGDRDEDDFGDQGKDAPSTEIIPPPNIESSTAPSPDTPVGTLDSVLILLGLAVVITLTCTLVLWWKGKH